MTDKAISKPVAKPATKLFWGPGGAIIFTLFVYLSSQLVASLALLTLPLAFGWSHARLENWLDGTTGQFLFVLLIELLVVLMIRWLLRLRKASFTTIGLKDPRLSDIGYGFVGFGIYFLLFLVVSSLARVLFPGIDFDQQQKIGFEAVSRGPELILVFLSLVVMPPIVEEILARGFLYTGLRTKLSVWPAALITSLMFAMAHLQFGSGAPLLWIAAMDTFVLSFVLVYLREKTGSLIGPITLHMVKNSFAFVILFIVGVR